MSGPRVIVNTQNATYGQSATSRYIRALVRHLPDEVPVTFFDYRWRSRPYCLTTSSTARTVLWPMPPRVGEYLFSSLPRLRVGMLSGGYDILHLPDDAPFNAKARRTVATLHMAGPLQRPDLFDPGYCELVRAWVRRMRARCDCLITVSQHLRKLLIADFQFPPSQVVAIPLGIDARFRSLVGVNQDGPPTILYVGRIRQAKNVSAVCRVFRALSSRISGLRLLLVGPLDVSAVTLHGWLANDSDLIRRTVVTGQVGLDSPALLDYYQQAHVMLFPSYAEGWTSPPLEAMAAGVPVVTSNASSLPETVGEAALTADPDDCDGLAAAVERLLLDSQSRQEYIARGRQWSSQFTWETMASKTTELYRSLMR